MIEQPTGVPIPAEVSLALENARNNVSILEAESNRLERLISSQKRELVSQEGAKKDIENQIIGVENKLLTLEIEYKSISKTNNELKIQVELQIKDIASREISLSEREIVLHDEEESIKKEQEEITKEKSILESEKNKLDIERKKLNSIVEKLERVIKEL